MGFNQADFFYRLFFISLVKKRHSRLSPFIRLVRLLSGPAVEVVEPVEPSSLGRPS